MTPAERTRALRREQKAWLEDLRLKQTTSSDAIADFLDAAIFVITQQINEMPITEWEAWRLPQLKSEIQRALADLEAQLKTTGTAAANEAWQNGINRVAKPLESAGVTLAPELLQIDTRRLMAMRVFMIDRLADISTQAIPQINAQLGLISIGATDRHAAIQVIGKVVGEGGKARARTIIDTELSRMSEVARNEAHASVASKVPGIKKRWKKSNKLHSRRAHDKADGQIVDHDKPFTVNGIKMMHPHDPKAPAKEVINCGCKSLMHVDNWKTVDS
ncbi:MAG: phage minor head protein [Pseudomonadales bacterium]